MFVVALIICEYKTRTKHTKQKSYNESNNKQLTNNIKSNFTANYTVLCVLYTMHR